MTWRKCWDCTRKTLYYSQAVLLTPRSETLGRNHCYFFNLFYFYFFFSLLFPACLLGFLFICLFVSWRVFVFLCFLLFRGGFFWFWLTLFVWGFSLVLVLVFWGRLFAVAGWLKMISLVLFVYFCFASLFLICFLVEVGTLVLNWGLEKTKKQKLIQ